jgi:hypothetical protein
VDEENIGRSWFVLTVGDLAFASVTNIVGLLHDRRTAGYASLAHFQQPKSTCLDRKRSLPLHEDGEYNRCTIGRKTAVQLSTIACKRQNKRLVAFA